MRRISDELVDAFCGLVILLFGLRLLHGHSAAALNFTHIQSFGPNFWPPEPPQLSLFVFRCTIPILSMDSAQMHAKSVSTVLSSDSGDERQAF